MSGGDHKQYQQSPHPWSPSDAGSPTSKTLTPVSVPPPPPLVPKQGGGPGTTTVDVPTLDLYAKNIGLLIPTVEDALTKLKALEPLAPGAFYHAYQILTKVQGSGGLVPSYTEVLTDLANGLTDIQNAVNQMATKYKSFDDLNKLTVTELQNDLTDAENEFNALMKTNGGAPVNFNPPTITTTPG
jgi:hypothetical protein